MVRKRKKTTLRKRKFFSPVIEDLEKRELLASDWQNAASFRDVDDSARIISPLDALLIINELNDPVISDPVTNELPPVDDGTAPPPFLDVDGDNFVSPIDAIRVVNALNGDNDAPEITVALANDTGIGGVNADGITSDPVIAGSLFDDVTSFGAITLTASVDGSPSVAVTVEPDGSFSFDPGLATDGTQDGLKTIQLLATDDDGHSTDMNISFVLDSLPPAITDLGLNDRLSLIHI